MQHVMLSETWFRYADGVPERAMLFLREDWVRAVSKKNNQLGKGDRKSRKGKTWRKSYGKYRIKKSRKKSLNKIKKIYFKNSVKIDWDERMQYLNEYLRNGGVEKIYSPLILRSILEVQFDRQGKVIEDSISGPLRAFSRGIYISQLQEPFLSGNIVLNYQSLVQKEIYFEQTNIETCDEFDTIYNHYKSIGGNHLFRGVNEAKYRILSSIQRQWLWQNLDDSGVTPKELTELIIEKAKSDASEILKNHFEKIGVDINNEISILSFLQHYRCPTPLVDWTFNFDNALFFALSGIKSPQEERRIDNYISVYLIEERHIIEGSLKELIRTSLQALSGLTKPAMVKRAKELGIDENYANKALTEKAVERVALASYAQRFLEEKLLNLEYLYTHPFLYFSDLDNFDYNISFALRNNQNVINQEGVFMWNNSPNLPIEQVGRNEALAASAEANYRFCKCLNINKKLENHIKKKLESNGVTEDFIYPQDNKKEFEELAKKSFDEAVKELKK